jgi:hypothetical protein
MTDTIAKSRARREPGHTALIVGLVIEIVWSLYSLGQEIQGFAAQDLAASLGQIVGHSLFITPLVWVVVYLGFARRSAPERGVPYALILFIVPVLLQSGLALALRSAAVRQQGQIRIVAEDLEQSLNALSHSGSGAPPAAVRVKPTGEAGEIDRLILTYMTGLKEDQAAYQSEITATGCRGSLDPEHLARDPRLHATRANLAKAREVVKKYRARTDWRLAEFRKAVSSSAGLTADAKQGILGGFDRAAREQNPDAIWDLEDAALVEMDAAAADLQHPRGRWIVRGHKLLFSSPDDLVNYQVHAAKLSTIGARENALRETNRQSTANDLKVLKQ